MKPARTRGGEWLRIFAVTAVVAACVTVASAAEPPIPAESPQAAQARHERVARRRGEVQIICHRGALEFAHENTLPAYRATFELGADGNEIDIRATRDGVLICFHDDMLDNLLHVFGDAAEFTWDELQRFSFRRPGPLGEQCRIPTLEETLLLHRQHAGLLHLDIKRPGLDERIAALLDRLDMWDHVVQVRADTGGAILADARCKTGRYKAGLYLDGGEVDPQAIEAALARPGDSVIVEDPRGALLALGRKIGRPTSVSAANTDLTPQLRAVAQSEDDIEKLLAILHDDEDWDNPAVGETAEAESAETILRRARAAEQLGRLETLPLKVQKALARRVRKRSLHRHWKYHALDGQCALRALIGHGAPQAVELARFSLWRDDPALESIANPTYKTPRAWVDWRIKMTVFVELRQLPGAASRQLCRDYLALNDDEAEALGPLQFARAGRALLAISPNEQTALELMRHRRGEVRGRAILDCVARAKQPWARAALETAAPHALKYIISDR